MRAILAKPLLEVDDPLDSSSPIYHVYKSTSDIDIVLGGQEAEGEDYHQVDVYIDGSGGEHSRDPYLCRCGRGWVKLNNQGGGSSSMGWGLYRTNQRQFHPFWAETDRAMCRTFISFALHAERSW
jgi:hypothetical protein